MNQIRVKDPMLLWPLLPYLANGCSNEEIGKALYLSQDGVKSRVSSLLHHMDARTRAHAVSLAHRSGLLTPDGQLPGHVALAVLIPRSEAA